MHVHITTVGVPTAASYGKKEKDTHMVQFYNFLRHMSEILKKTVIKYGMFISIKINNPPDING